MWCQGQWEALKKTASDGANKKTNKQTNTQTDGHRDSMTESAQWGRFSENKAPLLVALYESLYLWIYLWCIICTALFSAQFTLFLLVSRHKILVFFGDRNLLLLQQLFSVTETRFLWWKLVSLTETFSVTESFFSERTFLCDKNLLLRHKLLSVTETCICDRIVFLWQKLVENIVLSEKHFFVCHFCVISREKFPWEIEGSVILDIRDINFVEPSASTHTLVKARKLKPWHNLTLC